MPTKTITTFCGTVVTVKYTSDVSKQDSYFKYSVLNVSDGIVSFKLIKTPRNTDPNSDGGNALLSITTHSSALTVATCVCPEVLENTLYVHGSNESRDSIILEMPIAQFNLMQIGMLVWNISVIGHKTKTVYKICYLCNSFNEVSMPLNAVPTGFSLNGDVCCPLPEFIDIIYSINNDSHSLYNTARATCSPWYKNKHKLYANTAHIVDIISNFYSCVDKDIEKVRVENRCQCCGVFVNENIKWLYFPDTMSRESYTLCAQCESEKHTCLSCGGQGKNYHSWGEDKLCPSCTSVGSCYLCEIDNMPYEDVARRHIRNNDCNYGFCFDHYNIISRGGWSGARLLPEKTYNFKISASDLKVLCIDKHDAPIETSALTAVSKEPVCALEWEFPFSEQACKTAHRDRAIWLFNDIQAQAGHPELFIAKHDGSLPAFATEFVSNMPKTLKMWHKLYFDGVLRKLASLLDQDILKSRAASIGGHIHISRASFTKVQVAKALKFMYSNIDFMSFICNRNIASSSNGYYSSSTGVNPLSFAYFKSQTSPEKYTLARVTHNMCDKIDMGTIEVRAFKAPANDVEAIQNIEFMFALREFVRHISGNDSNKSGAFIDYVQSNIKTYPLLHEKLYAKPKPTFVFNTPNVPAFLNRPQPTQTANCYLCGYAEDINNMYSRDGHLLCGDCDCDNTFPCDGCNTIHLMQNRAPVFEDSRYVCESCREDAYHYCGSCDDWFPNDICCDCPIEEFRDVISELSF